MEHHQLQVRIGRLWYDVGHPKALDLVQRDRRAMITSALNDNGPDARQYARTHTRIVRITVTTETDIVEDE